MREPDLAAWIHRTQRLMNEMPFGGTYFRATTPAYSDKSVQLADRLDVIERNLASLRDALRDHVVPELEQLRSERYERRDQLRSLAKLFAAIDSQRIADMAEEGYEPSTD